MEALKEKVSEIEQSMEHQELDYGGQLEEQREAIRKIEADRDEKLDEAQKLVKELQDGLTKAE